MFRAMSEEPVEAAGGEDSNGRERPGSGGSGGPETVYRRRIATHGGTLDSLSRRSRHLSHARAAAFVVLVAAGLYAERTPTLPVVLAVVAVLLLFAVLVVAHQRVRRRELWYTELVRLNEEGLYRLDRAWESLPVRAPGEELRSHPYAGDLDLFGRASLSQVLGPPGSAAGARILDGWLLERSPPEAIRQRQQAVVELAPLLDFRETLAVHGRRTRTVRRRDVDDFLDWAESAPWLPGRTALRAASFLLPAASWLLIVLQATGVVAGTWWLVPVLATLALHFTVGAAVRRRFDDAFGREGMFTAWPELLRGAAAMQFSAPALQSISGRLARAGEPADRQLARLGRLMHLADLRLSMMHIPVNVLTLWDVHVLAALERWQAASGGEVRGWIEAVGELEALCALATLAHDEPAWTFAEIVTGGAPLIEAECLGHPLIPAVERVCNDVQVGPPGSFLFVTGSNMSGKSTLLRAIGANVVLAQAGAPSCARRLRIPPIEVHTSIRVQDSLARGVSYFMAELERLKQIVDAAERVASEPDVTLLFLLDEILHGTNTAERRIAARRVMRHLVDRGAIGAATTHDLELAEEPELVPSARLVHFQEDVEEDDDGSTLSFDYRLRSGLATSTNALKLMRLVGLPEA
jgi:hypothetical protein